MATLTVRPNADGSFTQFTPLSGNNYQNVDEVTADDDTTYNKTPSGGFGTRTDTFTGDMSAIGDNDQIDSIAVHFRGKQGPGWDSSDQLRAVLYDGALSQLGTLQDLATTYGDFSETYSPGSGDVMPDDGADLKANWEFGYRAQSNNLGDDDIRVTQCWIVITYTPNRIATHSTDAYLLQTTTKQHTTDGLIIPTGKYYSREVKTTLPTNNAILATLYTSGEYSDVDADDNVYVDLTGTGNLVHQFVRWNDNNTEEISISVKAKTTLAPTVRTVYLQIYNQNSGAWETLDSDNTTAADTEFTLTGSQTTNLSNYYSSGFASYFRIYQDTA